MDEHEELGVGGVLVDGLKGGMEGTVEGGREEMSKQQKAGGD